jgi:hypothetical protein
VVVTEPDTPVCHHQPPTTIRLRAPPSR